MGRKGHTGTSMGGYVFDTRKRKKKKRLGYTKAGPVVILRPDGTAEERPAYTPEQLAWVRRKDRDRKAS